MSQAGEHPWQRLPGPACGVSLQLARAEGAPAGQRHGVAPVAEPPSPAPVLWHPRALLGQAAPLPAGSPEGRGQWGGGQGRLLALFLPHAQLMATQVVVEGLHVGEDTLRVWLLPHDHHVFHLHQGHAVHQRPAETQPSAQPWAGSPTAGAGMGDPRCPGPAGAGHHSPRTCSAPAHPSGTTVLLLLAPGRVHAACNRSCPLCHPGALCPRSWCWQSPPAQAVPILLLL